MQAALQSEGKTVRMLQNPASDRLRWPEALAWIALPADQRLRLPARGRKLPWARELREERQRESLLQLGSPLRPRAK